MKSLRWALIQYDWCPYKKKKLRCRYVQREDHVKTPGKNDYLQAEKGSIGRNQPC
ncbi:unnamed protein product [Nyctereutes procyonoides]|uniref:(raccoon dog) hypothetical protein n=1 Tax=Nyctereutes procyonoides TaxID=34880 RepID=A0A811Y8K6_NYCPR|nr:unnamed protein product [Nyctereutes procyonoides]